MPSSMTRSSTPVRPGSWLLACVSLAISGKRYQAPFSYRRMTRATRCSTGAVGARPGVADQRVERRSSRRGPVAAGRRRAPVVAPHPLLLLGVRRLFRTSVLSATPWSKLTALAAHFSGRPASHGGHPQAYQGSASCWLFVSRPGRPVARWAFSGFTARCEGLRDRLPRPGLASRVALTSLILR